MEEGVAQAPTITVTEPDIMDEDGAAGDGVGDAVSPREERELRRQVRLDSIAVEMAAAHAAKLAARAAATAEEGSGGGGGVEEEVNGDDGARENAAASIDGAGGPTRMLTSQGLNSVEQWGQKKASADEKAIPDPAYEARSGSGGGGIGGGAVDRDITGSLDACPLVGERSAGVAMAEPVSVGAVADGLIVPQAPPALDPGRMVSVPSSSAGESSGPPRENHAGDAAAGDTSTGASAAPLEAPSTANDVDTPLKSSDALSVPSPALVEAISEAPGAATAASSSSLALSPPPPVSDGQVGAPPGVSPSPSALDSTAIVPASVAVSQTALPTTPPVAAPPTSVPSNGRPPSSRSRAGVRQEATLRVRKGTPSPANGDGAGPGGKATVAGSSRSGAAARGAVEGWLKPNKASPTKGASAMAAARSAKMSPKNTNKTFSKKASRGGKSTIADGTKAAAAATAAMAAVAAAAAAAAVTAAEKSSVVKKGKVGGGVGYIGAAVAPAGGPTGVKHKVPRPELLGAVVARLALTRVPGPDDEEDAEGSGDELLSGGGSGGSSDEMRGSEDEDEEDVEDEDEDEREEEGGGGDGGDNGSAQGSGKGRRSRRKKKRGVEVTVAREAVVSSFDEDKGRYVLLTMHGDEESLSLEELEVALRQSQVTGSRQRIQR